MRAARLLQILLLLQNRGRLTCAALSMELEVTRRTILRDVDALSEAGLPIVVIRGNQGGIELGFNYRTRLTGLAADEAEALGVLLAQPSLALDQLDMRSAAQRATTKLIESFPDGVRDRIARSRRRFRFEAMHLAEPDERIRALALAVREHRIVYIQAASPERRMVHPAALVCGSNGWSLVDAMRPEQPIALDDCGDINISGHRYRGVDE